jgi:sugar lactone lactonase YvrE
MLRIEIFSEQKDSLGEGPLWDVKEQRLYWIDSYAPAVHRADLKGGDRKTWKVPEPIGSMALREKGGAVLALRSGFHFLDFESGGVSRIVETHPGELRPRLNDGKVDRQGRFVAGSMDYAEREPVGKLFRLDPDLSLHTLDSGIICSNGPCWSPDGKTLYFADSFKKTIFAYDYDTATGSVRSQRGFATFADRLTGYPDGATVDADGFVWSVEVYAGRLVRFNPEGVVDRIVGMPVFSTTSISFGGPNLDIAFVTSMARPFNGAYHPEREAGMVFAVHGLGVRGLPEPRFNG